MALRRQVLNLQDSGAVNVCIKDHLVPELFVIGPSLVDIESFTTVFKTSPGVVTHEPMWDEPSWLNYTAPLSFSKTQSIDVALWSMHYPRCKRNVRMLAVDGAPGYFTSRDVPKQIRGVYESYNLHRNVRFMVILQEPAQRMRDMYYRMMRVRECDGKPATLQAAVDQFLSGTCTCACLSEMHVSYAASLRRYFRHFSSSQFHITTADRARGSTRLVADMWRVFHLPHGAAAPPSVFLRAAKTPRKPLEEELEPAILHALRRTVEPHGGALAVARVLRNSEAHLHNFGGATDGVCKIAEWLWDSWGTARRIFGGSGGDWSCVDGEQGDAGEAPVLEAGSGRQEMREDGEVNATLEAGGEPEHVTVNEDGLTVELPGEQNTCIHGTLVPQFFLVGAPKSSTTTFVEVFGSSKGVVFYKPGTTEEEWHAKEPWIFAEKHTPSMHDWLPHYPKCDASVRQLAIDCTPGYFGVPSSPRVIYTTYSKFNMAGRLFFMVLIREPIRRMQSHFYHHQSRGECGDELPKSFQDVVTNFLTINKTCDCDCEDSQHSLYAEAFDRYFRYFAPSQFTVVPFVTGVTKSMDLAKLTWSRLNIPGGSGELEDDSVVGHIGQNHHDYPELQDDVDPTNLTDFETSVRLRTGPMQIAARLVGTTASLFQYAGSASDQCGIAQWIASGWGAAHDKSLPCATA